MRRLILIVAASALTLAVAILLPGCREDLVTVSVKDTSRSLELTLTDGTAIIASAGTLPAGATVSIRRVNLKEAPPLPDGFDKVELLYDFNVSKPLRGAVTLRIAMPKVTPDPAFSLFHYRQGQWEAVPFTLGDQVALVGTDYLSFWGWLKMKATKFVEWADEKIMKYADVDTYIDWFEDVVGISTLMELNLENTPSNISYDDSSAKGLISASAVPILIDRERVRLRVRNETKFYLQISFEGAGSVEPGRGGIIADLAKPISQALGETLPPGTWLLLPKATAEFIVYKPGQTLTVKGVFSDLAAFYSTLDPALGLVPIVDLEVYTAIRDVLGEGSRFVRSIPFLEKSLSEYALDLLDLVETASRTGVLLGEKAIKTLAGMLVIPKAVEYRRKYLEGRALDIFQKAPEARAGVYLVFKFPTEEDRNPPSSPTNLKATIISPTQIDLSWTAATDNVGVAGYKIYRNGLEIASATQTSYTDTGLAPSTRYCYTASAYDAAGNESARSDEVCASTPAQLQNQPPIISSLTANPTAVQPGGQSRITVSAYDPEDDPLTFTWSTTGGTLSSTTSPAVEVWSAPNAPGAYKITVTVTDNQPGHSPVSQSVAVTVVEGAVKEPVSSAERIAFVSAGYIHLISPEGKDEIRLTEGERPVWSPDGEKIAYMLVTRSGEDGLYLINRDGTNKIKVAKMVTITGREYIDIDILGYSWSPDGREIAFTRKSILAHPELSQPGIYLVNADGTNLHRLSEESSLDVSFSPDGSRIAYIGMGKEDEDYYLYIINADGEGKTKLSPIPTGPIHVYSRNLTWSRQGMIAYVDGDANLFVITPPGRPMKLDENAGYPSWSPDGGKIAYLKPVYGEASLRPSLYIANPDGTGKTELATFTAPDSFNFSAPSWSPDGRKIVFSPGERIYIVSLDNGAKTGLTYGLSPQWAPAAMGVSLERGEERGEMLGDCAVMIQPGESIQAVIDTAEEGAVICLAEGTWEENIVIKKSLTLQGTGQEKPIIKGLKEGEPVILIISAEEIKVTVKGLTIAEAGKFCAGGQLHCSHGFSLGGKAKVTIEGNTISENADGIYIQDSARATITGNTISGHGDGILMEDSAQATITGNTISRNGIGIYISDAAQATIQGNTISGNGWDGIWIRASAQATILKNTISRNGYDGGQGGIVMADSAQATIQGNTISENRGINIMDGIVMADSARATITGNTISSHTGNGIIINFSAQATITENTISRNNGNGILMENSAQATITENTISENGSGIFMEDLKIQATIQGNKITDNERYGVMLEVMLEHYAHGYPPGQVFSGRVRGGSNAISRNIKGDVYPSPELDFLMTEEGGCYGHLC